MTNTRRPARTPPFPDMRAALLLTIAALFAGGLIGLVLLESGLDLVAAEGIGTAFGMGGIATLAARRIAEPQAARIGLVPLDGRAIPLILCLVPAALIASEVDNFAYDWSPPALEKVEPAPERAAPAAEQQKPKSVDLESAGKSEDEGATLAPLIDPTDPFSLLAGLIVVVGIAPVIQEFLFRGVIQQGLVAERGALHGAVMTALLWSIVCPKPLASPMRFAAALVCCAAMGWLLGMVRIATGSILGSTLLSSLWASISFASLVLKDRVDLPGMNVDGTHLPVFATAMSLSLVFLAGWRLVDLVRLVERTASAPRDTTDSR